ncbi:M50 family metallopeptidase [Paenibacillus agricola]|uniref:M50 family metallopeptidase n=1 Tax=Paenibacillus agricola TaxID=2716264 RepID=A0ABX0JAY8_9BACL|nr:M50 family metallopeptidase [Paenibacillus agricola]NHN32560.1 M50 family metallopeptidase [Paenibacillus agricola]
MSSWLKTVCFLIGSVLLTRWIPFSSFFRSLDTMIHEFGHALVTLAFSGKVNYIELNADHSGVTLSSVTNSWSVIPIALAGYMLASLFAVFLFKMQAIGKQSLGLQVITVLAIISLLVFVRNGYGMVWLIGFIILNVVMLFVVPRWLRDGYYMFMAFLTLEESVMGPISLILYAWNDPASAGDATNLGRMTLVPAIVWALLFTLFSLWCAKSAIGTFLRSKRARPAPPESTVYPR